MNFAMATLGLKEMVKFLWEGREKSLPSWLSQFSFTKLRQPTGQTFFPNFPKEFSHFLQTLAEFFWKMQRKTWYSILGLDAMPLSLKNLLTQNLNSLKNIFENFNFPPVSRLLFLVLTQRAQTAGAFLKILN